MGKANAHTIRIDEEISIVFLVSTTVHHAI